jgi:Flp pilus assembly pilin Flp
MDVPGRELCNRAGMSLVRLARDTRGQTAAEYVGLLLVISVIIFTLSGTGIGDEITSRLSDLVRDIASGDSGK